MKKTLSDALEARGYTTLTAVQDAVTTPETLGRDMLVSAQTGSGKTVGFGLAIAPGILGEADTFDTAGAPLALVIAPTRELALQVRRELAWLFENTNAVVTSTVGGMDMRDERRALGRGAHIVVATPGRLRDHIMRGSIDLASLRAVVLDEADEMLDLGFREDLEFILENAPAERQTLMFSATVPASIAKLAKTYQSNAIRIEAAGGADQHADIAYRALRVAARDVENGIINVLRFYEAPNSLVFCNTRAMVNRLTTRLSNRGFSVVALSGELSQTERTHALQAMRDGRARVCVATDVAARGIDLPNLELVIHADLPTNQETLLHRSGRTGRAGRKGTSALIVPPAARKKAERLLSWAKLTADWDDAPGAEEVTARDLQRLLADPEWYAPIAESDTETVETLVASFTVEQIAAAYLRLYHERHSAPEDLSDVTEKAKPREAFGPSVWFTLAGGRAARAEPRRLLPMLCKMGGLSREDIGAIRIQPEETLIELRASAADRFVATVGPAMVLENGAALKRLPGAPTFDAGPARGPRGKVPERREAPERTRPAPKAAAPVQDAAPTGEIHDAQAPHEPAARTYRKEPGRYGAGGAKPRKAGDAASYHPDANDGRPKAGKPPVGKTTFGKPSHSKADAGKPPVGKPSSKKNRARQLAAGKAGGAFKPRKPGGGSGQG